MWDRPAPGRLAATLAIAALAAAITVGFAWRSDRGQRTIAPRPAAPIAAAVGTSGGTAREPLVVLSVRSYTGAIGDFQFVEGTVRSDSVSVLDHVEAFCTWYDENDTVVAAESNEIDSPALSQGQTSTFRVMTRARNDLARFTVTFKQRGVDLPSRPVAPAAEQAALGDAMN